jgi:peptidyl-tRNA hydrolase, PTH1 family
MLYKIIVGLGNPGDKYEFTRHNAGFLAIDSYARSLGIENNWETNKKLNIKLIKDGQLILAKPMTFMNNSGEAVSALMSYYKCLPKNYGFFTAKDRDLSDVLTVIHDEIDITLGKFKISGNSGSAGHRGVESIFNHLKTKKIRRIRLGIRPVEESRVPADKLVLAKFSEEELLLLQKTIQEAIKNI